MTADGRMDRKEFSIAMHLIKKSLLGYQLPQTLPYSLLADPPPLMAGPVIMPPLIPPMAPSSGFLVHNISRVGMVTGNIFKLFNLLLYSSWKFFLSCLHIVVCAVTTVGVVHKNPVSARYARCLNWHILSCL